MAAVYNWTGFYIGADVGGGWGPNISETTVDTTLSFDPNTFGRRNGSGVVGGLYAGYNWQWNSPLGWPKRPSVSERDGFVKS
jgi:outer membrane immunogenic protein